MSRRAIEGAIMTLACPPPSDACARHEGPAVLRLRMLELGHALRIGVIDARARADAEAALAALRAAVLTRPSVSLADLAARIRTEADAPRTGP